jgi:hypothetical protein
VTTDFSWLDGPLLLGRQFRPLEAAFIFFDADDILPARASNWGTAKPIVTAVVRREKKEKRRPQRVQKTRQFGTFSGRRKRSTFFPPAYLTILHQAFGFFFPSLARHYISSGVVAASSSSSPRTLRRMVKKQTMGKDKDERKKKRNDVPVRTLVAADYCTPLL